MQNDDKYGFSSESSVRNEIKPNTEENRKKSGDIAAYVLMYMIGFIHMIKTLVYTLEEMQRNKEAEQKAAHEQETAKKLADLAWSTINQQIKQFIENSKKKIEELQAAAREKELAEHCLMRISERIRQLNFEVDQIKTRINIITNQINKDIHKIIARVNEILDTFPKELSPQLKDYFNNVIAPRYLKEEDRQSKEMLPEIIDEISKYHKTLMAKEKPAGSEKASELQKKRIETQKAAFERHEAKLRSDKTLNEISHSLNTKIDNRNALKIQLHAKAKESTDLNQQLVNLKSQIERGNYKEININSIDEKLNIPSLNVSRELTGLEVTMKEGEKAVQTILNIAEEGRVPDEKMLNSCTVEINSSAALLVKEINAIEIEKAPELGNSEPKPEDVQQVSDELDKLFKDVEAGLNIASESPLKDPGVAPESASCVADSIEKSAVSSGFFSSDSSKSLSEVEGAPSDKEKEHENVTNEEIEGEEPRRSFQHR